MQKRARKHFRSIHCDCEKEKRNSHTTFASKGIAGVFAVLRRRGSYYIECRVTGRRKYSADLARGGLEVPCSLLFKATLMEPVGSESALLGPK